MGGRTIATDLETYVGTIRRLVNAVGEYTDDDMPARPI